MSRFPIRVLVDPYGTAGGENLFDDRLGDVDGKFSSTGDSTICCGIAGLEELRYPRVRLSDGCEDCGGKDWSEFFRETSSCSGKGCFDCTELDLVGSRFDS